MHTSIDQRFRQQLATTFLCDGRHFGQTQTEPVERLWNQDRQPAHVGHLLPDFAVKTTAIRFERANALTLVDIFEEGTSAVTKHEDGFGVQAAGL